MSRILLAYSTVDGHTRNICDRLRQHLERQGHAVVLASLSDAAPTNVPSYDKVVIGASIRYGKHRQEVYDFIRINQRALEDRPSAFFSVNVVARKPGKDTPETNPYMKDFRRKSAWQPALLAVFAGKIDYPRYAFLDRQMIRFIMWVTHGPTGAHDCVEFTNWASVDAFGKRVADL
ncbi:MAG: menaquinone-dependent protoporphyrinogen IX dehydrogenase [Rhodocyclaceae bacterium]|jgi:menaquinone-dependent protoporphyrinogen oxidase|nr:menaquinone-dependent protoporphyrinogen IX dehydrogenase [Rhodocyclaceae bacterium]